MRPFDANGAFQPTADGKDLRRLAVKGAGATVFSSLLSTGIQIVATVVLARLLSPQDFGVVAMVTTFSLLLVNFGLNGFTEAVVQREEINHFLVSNLFWINVGFGVLLTAGFAASGTLLAKFYQNPRVVPVSVGVSATILVTSTSVQHIALLKRAMRFSALSVNDIIARFAGVGVAVILGLAGCGYWALIAGVIAQPLSQSIGAFFLCRWRPGRPRRVPGTASMVRFAMNIYGRFTMNYFARNLDNLLVGWRFNAQALGFYKKAYDLFALPAAQLVSPLTSVAVSALSKLKPDSEQYKRYLLNALAVTALVGMGLGATLTLVGADVIRLLLGPGWEEAGRIFTFFGPGIGVMLLYGTHGWIHLSIGKGDRWLRWGLVEFVVTGTLFVLALAWGPVGIAVAWTASFWILTIPSFWYAGRPIHLGVRPVIAVVWRYVVASVLASFAAFAIIRSILGLGVASSAMEAAVHILVKSVVFAAIYVGTVILLHWGCAPLSQLAGLLREMVPRSSFPKRQASVAATSEALVP
jgi:polysaccharide transporter, PST family